MTNDEFGAFQWRLWQHDWDSVKGGGRYCDTLWKEVIRTAAGEREK